MILVFCFNFNLMFFFSTGGGGEGLGRGFVKFCHSRVFYRRLLTSASPTDYKRNLCHVVGLSALR